MKKMTWTLACFLLVTSVAYGAESETSSGDGDYTYDLSGYESYDSDSYYSDTEDEEASYELGNSTDALINYLRLTVEGTLPYEVLDTHVIPRCSDVSVSEKEKTEPFIDVLHGHTDRVNYVSFGADGKTIVSCSRDKTVKEWDLDRRQEMSSSPGICHTFQNFDLCGLKIVSALDDGTVKVWNHHTEQEIYRLQGHTASVITVVISNDGKTIVSGSCDKTVKVWDADTGQEVHTLRGHTGSVCAVRVSADGSRVVSGSLDKTVRVWDANVGQEIHTLQGHTGLVLDVKISKDGKKIISGSADKTIGVWHLPGIEWAKNNMTLLQYGLIKTIQEFGEFCKEKEQPLSLSVLAWRLLGLDNASVKEKDVATTEVAALFNSIPTESREYLVKKNNMLPVCLSAEAEPRALCNLLDDHNDYKPRTWLDNQEQSNKKSGCCCIVS